MTKIRSASITVESRRVITMLVLSRQSLRIAFWTSASLLLSRALVASSSNLMNGFRKIERAIAIRCLCPPERRAPFSPTIVWYPSGSSLMNWWASAWISACWISQKLEFGLPNEIFSSIVCENKATSLGANPRELRRALFVIWFTGILPIQICPSIGM